MKASIALRAPALAIALCTVLVGCGDRTGRASTAQPPASPTAQGERVTAPPMPRSYRFVLTSSCGERGLLGDYGVTVRDDRVTAVENLDEDYPYRPRLSEIPTLTDLAEMAESAPDESVVEYVVDDEGLPISLSLDPRPNAIDDEECYRVTDLRPLAGDLGLLDDDEPQNPTADRRGPVPDGGTASCVEEYSPAAVAGRAFAFDGVVLDVGPSVSDRGDEADLELPGVTFEVEEWFSGGDGDTVTVDVQLPTTASADPSDPGYVYGIGSRLLVSGEARWGGSPLQQPIAWGCGFTRYHDRDTAEAWRAAVG